MADRPKLTEYLFSYRYGDSEFSFSVPAYSLEEAKGRVKAMTFARYDGELMLRLAAGPGAGLLVRVITGFRNMVRKP